MSHPFLAVVFGAVAGALALVAVEALAPGWGAPIGLGVMGVGLLGASRAPRVA